LKSEKKKTRDTPNIMEIGRRSHLSSLTGKKGRGCEEAKKKKTKEPDQKIWRGNIEQPCPKNRGYIFTSNESPVNTSFDKHTTRGKGTSGGCGLLEQKKLGENWERNESRGEKTRR